MLILWRNHRRTCPNEDFRKQNILKAYGATHSMSNTNATEGNTESPSTYGQEGKHATRHI